MTRSKHLISRRETLRLIGAAGATAAVAWSGEPAIRLLTPRKHGSVVSAQSLSCVVRPQLTEGPYFVDERLNRSDIRTDPMTNVVKAGLPLFLKFNVSRTSGGSCVPLSGAYVDREATPYFTDYGGLSSTAIAGNRLGSARLQRP